jgi:hypothetical protein
MSSEILSIFLGIGLASATGFRVFLPLFALSLTSYFHLWELNSTLDWIGRWPALITLGIAMIAEIFAYYIPYIDNLLDTIATPLAAIAGTLVMASTIIEIDPMITWGLAIIAGGGTATAMQGMTSATRLASTLKTGGLANPVVATAETGTALSLSIVSIFLPILAIIFVVGIFLLVFWLFRRFRSKKPKS